MRLPRKKKKAKKKALDKWRRDMVDLIVSNPSIITEAFFSERDTYDYVITDYNYDYVIKPYE